MKMRQQQQNHLHHHHISHNDSIATATISLFVLVLCCCISIVKSSLPSSFNLNPQPQYPLREVSSLSLSDTSISTTRTVPNVQSIINRQLEIGDFDELNEFLKKAVFLLPDTSIEQNYLVLDIYDLTCYDIIIGDIQTSWSIYNSNNNAGNVSSGYNETLAYDIILSPFELKCSAQFHYESGGFGLIRGTGNFIATIGDNSSAKTRIDINSKSGFTNAFPEAMDVEYCTSVINIIDLNINAEAFIIDTVLDLAKNLITNVIEEQTSTKLCTTIKELEPQLNDLLTNYSKKVDKWMEPVSDELQDPLYIEQQNFTKPDNITLVNFMNNDGNNNKNSTDILKTDFSDTISNLIVIGMKEVEPTFGRIVNDPNGPTADGKDLAINVLLRKSVLNEDRVFVLNISSLSNENDLFSEDGIMSLLEYDIKGKLTNTKISLTGARITGLDTITTFSPLVAIGNDTLQNKLAWDKLAFEVDLSISIKSPTRSDAMLKTSDPSVEVIEKVTIAVAFTKINIDASIFVAIDVDKLGELQFGSLLYLDNILPCILDAMYDVQLSGLVATVEDMTKPTFSGFISPGIDRVVSSVIEAAAAAFKPTIVNAMPNIFQGPVRNILSKEFLMNFLSKNSGESSSRCPNAADKLITTDKQSYVDFRELLLAEEDSVALGGDGTSRYGTIFRMAYKLITDKFLLIDPETNLAAINENIIAKFTKSKFGTAGGWDFAGDLINVNTRIKAEGLDASLQIRAYDAYINNLDTLGAPLALLEPVNGEASVLNNTAMIGISRPLTLGMRLFVGLSNKDVQIKNDLEIRIALDEFQILLTALMKLSEKAFLQFPIKHILNFQCWLSTFPAPTLDKRGIRVPNSEESLRIQDFLGVVEKLKLDIVCKNCTGAIMREFTELISSNSSVVSVTDLANGLFSRASNLLEGEFLSVAIDRALRDAPKQCPHLPQYDKNYKKTEFDQFTINTGESSLSLVVGFMILCTCMIAAITLVVLATRLFVRRRHVKWLHTLSRQQVLVLFKRQRDDEARENHLNDSTTSMFKSVSVPQWIRLFMPVVILGNIGFFLSGHLSLGASVSLLISLGGETLRADDFFQFSMAKSTIEIWNAGGQALAMLIFVASFAWPYSKTLITLALWFAPPRWVSVSKRGAIFLWLDALAKWSIIDIFVLVITIVVLRVSMQSPDVSYLPDDFYQIDLLVVPKWGLYANMTAQLITQISSHYIIYYHRRLVDDALNSHLQKQQSLTITTNFDSSLHQVFEIGNNPHVVQRRITGGIPINMDSEPEKLCNHAFRRAHRGESDKLVARRIVAPTLVGLALILSVLVVLGCTLPSYSVRILGIVGVLVESGQGFKAADTSFSVISTIRMLFDQAKLTGNFGDYIGLGTLSILVLLSVLFVPILQALTLLYQWIAKINQQQRNRVSAFLEILQAWQYAEVYILAILVASWQLGDISEYLINPYCESLKGLFGQLVYYGLLKPEDAQCLKTDISVEPTFYLLFVGTVILAFINSFVMKAVSQYFHDHNSADTNVVQQKAVHLQDLDSLEDDGGVKADIEGIHPVSVMYTDTFRWLLYREDNKLQRATLRTATPDSPTGTYEMPDSPISSSNDLQPSSPDMFADFDEIEDGDVMHIDAHAVVDKLYGRSVSGLTDDNWERDYDTIVSR